MRERPAGAAALSLSCHAPRPTFGKPTSLARPLNSGGTVQWVHGDSLTRIVFPTSLPGPTLAPHLGRMAPTALASATHRTPSDGLATEPAHFHYKTTPLFTRRGATARPPAVPRLTLTPTRSCAPSTAAQPLSRCPPRPEQHPDNARHRDNEPRRQRLVAAADRSLDGQPPASAAAGGHRGGLPAGGGEPPSQPHDGGQRLTHPPSAIASAMTTPTVWSTRTLRPRLAPSTTRPAETTASKRTADRQFRGRPRPRGRCPSPPRRQERRGGPSTSERQWTAARSRFTLRAGGGRGGDGGSGRSARPHPRSGRVGVRARHRHLRRR